MKSMLKRFVTVLITTSLVGVYLFGVFAFARPTFAREPASSLPSASIISATAACRVPTSPGANPCEGTNEAAQQIDDTLVKPAIQVALLTAVLNIAFYFIDRLTYEAAIWVATGGEGETPLFNAKSADKAWEDFGLDIAGEAVGQLADLSMAALNMDFNICAPTNPIFALSLAIGLEQAYKPREPLCKFQDVLSNWDSFISTTLETATNPSQTVLKAVADGFKPGQNELSASIGLNIKVHDQVLQTSTAKLFEQVNSGGFKAVTDVVTGQVATPGSTIQQNFNDEVTKSKENKTEFSMNAVINNKDLLSSMFMHVAGVFTNTLLSTLMNRLYTGLFDVQPDIDPFGDVENVATVTREDAEERFSSLIAATPSSIENYSVLSEFLACPTGYVAVRNVNNCVLDTNFAAALARVDAGSPMTVQAAIDEGLINGDWPLFPNEGEGVAKNQDPECYTYGYCYGNLVKMRKARILPVGWEMAASRNDTTNPSTLQEIVDGFADCGDQGGGIDNSHQWCHLIDPNWVLKLPETQCRALANGEVLISNLSGGRAGVCADTPSCLSEDSNGKCDGGYGYCVEETNAWQFRGEDCDEQYATCLSFQNTFTNDSANYLLNTVEYSTCDADNAGCEWYRTNKYYDDAGTTDDDSDDEYLWLPGDEVYTTASREDDIRSYLSSSTSRTDYTYNTEGGTVESYETYAYEDRMYFNNNVEECSEDAVGCTEVFAIDDSLVLNLVQNPSFENDEDEDALPDNWSGLDETDYETAGDAYYGTDAITVNAVATAVYQENIHLAASSFYTFSFYTKGTATNDPAGTATLEFTDEDNGVIDLSGTSSSGDCSLVTDRYTITMTDDSSDWQQFTCTFTTADDPLVATVSFNYIVSTTSSYSILVDSVQLELGDDASSFTEGYNTSSPTPSYLLLPPDYLNCTGDATDPAECENYTQMCSALDVGCNLYTPEDGDPSVPAIATSVDECPSECVGYTTYKQEATDRDDDAFPLYFIADSSSSCSSQYVGCDEFTNLDAVADGGEGTESYTYLRACMKTSMTGSASDNTPSTFFTWEGSDAAGYQLMTWTLLDSNVSDAPCTTWQVSTESTLICAETGTYSAPTDCDEHDDIFDNPDCREFYDVGGNIHYRDFTETVTISDDCHPYRFTDSSETDCEYSGGFWTDAGDCRYFGLPDESTECPLAQAGCREYTGGAGRNATTVYSDDFEDGDTDEYSISLGDPATTSDDATAEISNESIATDGHSIRIETSSTVGASFSTVMNFLDWIVPDTVYDETDPADSTTSNSEITCSDIDSYRTVTDSGCEIDHGIGNACTVDDGDNNCGTLDDLLVNGKTYVLSFWAKGNAPIYVTFADYATGGTDHDFVDPNASGNDLLELEGGWHEYTLGPIDTSATGFEYFGDTTVINFYANSSTIFYLDNIQLKAVEEDITIIKDSWVVPSTCDQTPDGADSDQYYLGCEAYTDQDGNDVDLYQFSDLCSEDVVGCEAVYDTQNSDSEYGQVFNARCQYDTDGVLTTLETTSPSTTCTIDGEDYCTIANGESYCTFDVEGLLPTPLPSDTTNYFYVILGPETVVVPNDNPRYVVDNGDTTCTSENVACEEIGLPTYNQDKTEVESFESVYYINDPDDYADILCDDEALFCEEWSSTEDGNFYFKDPMEQTCEYQSGVTLNGTSYNGWFRTETNDPCYWTDEDGDELFDTSIDSSYSIAGSEFGIWRNGDEDFTGWGGTCPSSADLCKAFLDAGDTSEGEYPAGLPYYFLDNDTLSEEALTASEQCQGQVSQKEGCALFQETNDAELAFATGPSYIAATRADLLFGDTPGSLQDPIDCNDGGEAFETVDGESVNLCNLRCRYEVGTDVDLETGNQVESTDGTSEFAGSCYVDDDCPTLSAGDGNDYEGTCVDVTTDADGDGVIGDTEDAVYENDANRVIKVYRDRECSAWMACSTSRVVWDTRTSKYVTVCEQTARCTKYGSDGTTCIQSDTTDPEPLSVSRYASRDITWSGVEYSGYSIPDQLGIDHFSEININPDTNSVICVDDNTSMAPNPEIDTTDGGFVACDVDDDCGTGYECGGAIEEMIRLAAVVGDCSMATSGWEGDCSVGFCETSGDSCNDDTDCDTVSAEGCISGYCQDLSTTACASDADDDGDGIDDACADVGTIYPYCDTVQGYCVVQLTPNETGCLIDAECTGSCVQSARAYLGSCVNDMCIVGLDGEAIDPDDADESMCRGYPESFSPFPAKVVTSWVDNPGDTTTTTGAFTDTSSSPFEVVDDDNGDAIPYSYAYGYQSAAVCLPDPDTGLANDDCVCSYDKITYGNSSMTRYLEDGNGTHAPEALCVGGTYNGLVCDPADVNVCGTGSTCTVISRIDTYYGWHGYCLETDSSIQLYGSTDTDDQPCLTWLPVDQTSSSSDLYGKSEEAGYARENQYFCTEVGMYTDIYPMGTVWGSDGYIDTMHWACAEVTSYSSTDVDGIPADTTGDGCALGADCLQYDGVSYDVGDSLECDFGEYDNCVDNVYCPDGFVGLVGYCSQFKGDTRSSTERWIELQGVDSGDDGSDVGFEFSSTSGFLIETGFGDTCNDQVGVSATYSNNIYEYETLDNLDDLTDRFYPGTMEDSDDGIDDCPYFCIPDNSRHTEGSDRGGLCVSTDEGGGDDLYDSDLEVTVSGNGTTVFKIGAIWYENWDDGAGTNFNDIDKFKDCAVLGKEIDPDVSEYSMNWYENATGEVELNVNKFGFEYHSATGISTGGAYGLQFYPVEAQVCTDEAAADFCSVDEYGTQDILTTTAGAFRPYLGCYEVAQVSTDDATLAGTYYNKAWTNRTSSSSSYILDDGASSFDYSMTTSPTPLGAVPFEDYYSFDYSSIYAYGGGDPLADAWPIPVSSCNGDIGTNGYGAVGLYTVKDSGSACSSEYDYPIVSGPFYSGLTDGAPTAQPVPFEDVDVGSGEGGTELEVWNQESDATDVGDSATSNHNSFKDSLSQFFGKILRTFQFNEGRSDTYGYYDATDVNYDDTDYSFSEEDAYDSYGTGADLPYTDITAEPSYDSSSVDQRNIPDNRFAPLVVSVSTETGGCDGAQCQEGKMDHVTINGLDNGDLNGSDGQYHAVMSFFAYANANHMPLRKIIVDWSDADTVEGTDWGYHPSGSTSSDNYYKNFRGMNPEDDGETSLCDDSAWGKSSESCTTQYLTYSNDFVCTTDMVTSLQSERSCQYDDNGHLLTSPCTDGSSCVYQPRVHVIDNWGWCTGYCDGGAGGDETTECYEGSEPYNECDFQMCPGDSCDTSGTIDPWIYYDGVIKVSPD